MKLLMHGRTLLTYCDCCAQSEEVEVGQLGVSSFWRVRLHALRCLVFYLHVHMLQLTCMHGKGLQLQMDARLTHAHNIVLGVPSVESDGGGIVWCPKTMHREGKHLKTKRSMHPR
jgi:hypothetical protein